jgi:LacI family transcriptional regulator
MVVGKNPTLKDVARLAGTSIATASVVLNQTPHKYVSAELTQRVLEAARQLYYRPNIPARRMRGKSGRFLAILVPQFENVYFHRIVIGAENYANSRDYTLSIFTTYDQEEKELKYIENLISLQVDGVLISPAQAQSRSVALLRELNIPYVIIDRPVTEGKSDLVSIDYYQAALDGTKVLIERGHRQIAFIGWAHTMKSITDRTRGFRDAIWNQGISPDEVFIWEGERSREAACQVVLELLKERPISAIFAAHHQLGEGVLDAVHLLNKKVPDEVSILIFGNPTWATITQPKITCIAQPDMEIGRKAAELMIDNLENPDHEYHAYLLPYDFFNRESIRVKIRQ